jgi:hypothetical protein
MKQCLSYATGVVSWVAATHHLQQQRPPCTSSSSSWLRPHLQPSLLAIGVELWITMWTHLDMILYELTLQWYNGTECVLCCVVLIYLTVGNSGEAILTHVLLCLPHEVQHVPQWLNTIVVNVHTYNEDIQKHIFYIIYHLNTSDHFKCLQMIYSRMLGNANY